MKTLRHFLLMFVAALIFLSGSFSLSAEEMTLEQANAEISRLEGENQSLKDRLTSLKEEIAEFKEKIENHEINEIGNNEQSE